MSDNVRSLDPAAALAPFPDDLRAAERAAASGERAWRVGLALSGGGIRSATFCLGVLQGLAKANLLRHIDYLSTVSGGGYCGSFFGRLLCRTEVDELGRRASAAPDGEDRLEAAEQILADSQSAPLRFLRENGRFLAPHGTPDLVKGFAVALRNWAAVHVVMILSALFALSVLALLTHAAFAKLPIEILGPLVQVAPVGLSPAVVAGTGIIMLLFVACGWGYWLVPEATAGGDLLRGWLRLVVVAALDTLAIGYAMQGLGGALMAAFASAATATLVLFAVVWATAALRYPDADLAGRVQYLRSRYTQLLTGTMLVLAALLVLAAVDLIGVWLVRQQGLRVTLPALYGTAVAVVGALRPLLQRAASKDRAGARVKLPVGVLASAVAVLLLVAALGAITAVPKWIARRYDYTDLLWVTLGLGLVTLAMGQVRIFVNRSSLYSTYEERIRRAYLGASNAARLADSGPIPLADSHPDDGIGIGAYHPERFGGPVHIINVTINETVDGRSQVEQRDRKGLALAVGPGGISAGVAHHALWSSDVRAGLLRRALESVRATFAKPGTGQFRVFPGPASPELLDLGQWVAASGAAFSTGLGARTSFGLSVLAGLANVRLGYWWDSGISPQQRLGRSRRGLWSRVSGALGATFPAQAALLDEWLARFPGVARRFWYLSDGGHFENTAAYELIRRQLPFIMVCDCGADLEYRFEDAGNLVRKARTDFNTTIEFLDRHGLNALGVHSEQSVIGTLDDLRRHAGPDFDALPLARRHAALARITYPPDGGGKPRTGWLVLIKPTVTGTMPVDVLHYQAEHPDFPQQSTLDQFFDEAQWESYRCLGEEIAARLFDKTSGTWNPVTELQRTA